jgi:hypothetical protein
MALGLLQLYWAALASFRYLLLLRWAHRVARSPEENLSSSIVGGFNAGEGIAAWRVGAPARRRRTPDLTGRWYPNPSGRMLQFAYPLRRSDHPGSIPR